jgi:hypothetical protein
VWASLLAFPALGAESTESLRPFFLDSPSPAVPLNNPNQKPEAASLVAFFDELLFEGTIVTARPSLLEKSTDILIMLPGMGGNVRRWGATSESTLTFGNSVLKENIYPIVLEHPIYQQVRSGISPERRQNAVRRFMPIDYEIDFLAGQLNHIIERVPRNEDGSLSKRVWLFGRSNGTNRILELMDRFALGHEKHRELSESISGVFVSGIVNPNSGRSFIWQDSEWAESKASPDLVDLVAMELDHGSSAQMVWASPRVEPLRQEKFRVPRITAILSAQDGYYPFPLQKEAMEVFSTAHPQFSVHVISGPGKHDPTASFTLSSGKVVRQGRLLRDILKAEMHSTLIVPGLSETHWPGFSEAGPCPLLLKRMESVTLPALTPVK